MYWASNKCFVLNVDQKMGKREDVIVFDKCQIEMNRRSPKSLQNCSSLQGGGGGDHYVQYPLKVVHGRDSGQLTRVKGVDGQSWPNIWIPISICGICNHIYFCLMFMLGRNVASFIFQRFLYACMSLYACVSLFIEVTYAVSMPPASSHILQ